MSTELDNIEVPIIRPLWLNITNEPVSHLEESAGGDYFIAALASGWIRQIEAKTGETLFEVSAHEMGILSISLSSEKNWLATTGEDNQLKVWDLETKSIVFSYKAKSWIENVKWINDRLFFSHGKTLQHWEMGQAEPSVITTWDHSISDFTLKNDSELAVCGYSRLSVYDLETLKENQNFNWKGQLFKLTFSPNERFAVCASNDLSIHIWDLKRNKDLSMRGFASKIRDLDFRCDGLYMANSSGNEVIIWDYMDPGPANKKPTVLGPLEKDIQFVRYQHKGKILATFGDDGVIIFWRPDLFGEKPLSIAGIRNQSISSALWTRDDRHVVTGLQTGYVALYPVPSVQEK
jgi:WD40 repeat protein